jgi:hypothetical protein
VPLLNPFFKGFFYSKKPLNIKTKPIIKMIVFTAIFILDIIFLVRLVFNCCARYIFPKSIVKYVPTITKKNTTILYCVSLNPGP